MKYSKHGYKRNSKDKNNPYNIIPSSDITMKGVDFPVYGVDDLGNEKIMMPGANYTFPGNTVLEVPLHNMQQGGEESNMHPFEQWATSQGMNPQEALQMISANPKSYPPEVIEAAQSYAQELQRQNPINDKQDERIYEAKQEQSLYQEGNEVATDPGGPVIEEPEVYTLGTDELGNIPGEYYNSTGEFKKQPWLNRQGFREELKGPEYPWSFKNEEGYNEWDKEGMSEEDYFIKQDRDRMTQFILDNENIFTKPEVDAWSEEDRNWYVDAYKEDMPLNDFESSYPPMASGALTYDPLAFLPFPAGAVTSGIAKPVVGFLDDAVRGVRNVVPNFFSKTPLKKHADEVAEWMKKYYSHPKHKYQSHIHTEQIRKARAINDRISGASFDTGLPQSTYDMMREITPMPNLNQRISMRIPYDKMINPNISYKEMYKGVMPPLSTGIRDRAISNFRTRANISGDMMGNSALYNKSYRNLLQDLISDVGLRKGLRRFYDNFTTSSGVAYTRGLPHLPKTSGNFYTQSKLGPIRAKRDPKSIKSTMVHEGDHFYMDNNIKMPSQQTYALADLSKRNTYQGSPIQKLYKKLFGKNTKSFKAEKDYYQGVGEINARVMQMRYEMGMMPGDKLSKPGLEMYMKNNPDLHGMKKWLNVDESGKFNTDDFLKYFNNYYKEGGEEPEDTVYTYESNPEYFDNRATYHDNLDYSDTVREKVYAGTHGYNPATGALSLLDAPVTVPADVQTMSTREYGEAPISNPFQKGPGQPRYDMLSPEGQEQWTTDAKDNRINWVGESMQDVFQNPLTYVPAAVAASPFFPAIGTGLSTTLPGGVGTYGGALNLVGGGLGAYHLPGDVKKMKEDPSVWNTAMVGLDLAGIGFGASTAAPYLKNIFKTTGSNASYIDEFLLSEKEFAGITDKMRSSADNLINPAYTFSIDKTKEINSGYSKVLNEWSSAKGRSRLSEIIRDYLTNPYTHNRMNIKPIYKKADDIPQELIDDAIEQFLGAQKNLTLQPIGEIGAAGWGGNTGLPRPFLQLHPELSGDMLNQVIRHEMGHILQGLPAHVNLKKI